MAGLSGGVFDRRDAVAKMTCYLKILTRHFGKRPLQKEKRGVSWRRFDKTREFDGKSFRWAVFVKSNIQPI
jgi:hypothetical protein